MGSSQRIRRIKVTKLFGIFDHDIPLNMEERITILHGPNGFGKTKILEMTQALLGGDEEALKRVPFEEFSVEFEDDSILAVERDQSTGTEPISSEDLWFSYYGKENAHFPGGDPEETYAKWLDKQAIDLLTLLIGTQRLTTRTISSKTKKLQAVKTVLDCSNRIKREIKSALTMYARHAQQLDSTFLDRLFQVPPEAVPSIAELQKRLEGLNEKRAQLIRLGVLDPERDPHRETPRLEESKRDVLAVYVQDTEDKFRVLDRLSDKIALLVGVINKRFAYKRMSVSREVGLSFQSTVTGTPIPLECLSSGEQHDLVLLFKLLFEVYPDTLVLIDEPEISLHLAWQNDFLDDLKQVVALGGYEVLLATHSPAIINDCWDLTVELKGPDLPQAAE